MSSPLDQVAALTASLDAESEALYEQGPRSQEARRAYRLAESQMLALVAAITAMEAHNE